MSKRWIIAWITFIFALFLALAFYSFRKSNQIILVIAEFVIPALYAVTVWFVLKSLKPVTNLSRSMSLLKEGEFSITMVKTGNKEVDNIIDIYNSMILRLREERLTVREKNHFLDLLIESSPLGILVLDFDERILSINYAGMRCLGISQPGFEGKTLPELQGSLATELGKISFGEKKLVMPADGKKYLCRKLFFMDHGFRHPFYIIEEFTQEIRLAEREAYGKLIRMMAHEVNNTIGSVNSIMSSVQSNPGSFVEAEREDIVRILGVAIQRNYQMNKFMQNFSNVVKLPAPEKEKMNLNESVRNVLESYSAELKGKGISLRTDLDISEPAIYADRSQMEQVFLNILKNSKEAVGDLGHITVATLVNPIRIIFEDDGPGLSEAASEKLFTPFFSTKPGGQGIGLTLVQEILSNHGFSFSLKNKPGIGTIFVIYLQEVKTSKKAGQLKESGN
jgi:two-component system, NtrC family, nitrogen regulation sensor histidine kinase NtrY